MPFVQQRYQNLVGLPGKLFDKKRFFIGDNMSLTYQTMMLKIMNDQQQAKLSMHNVRKVFIEMIIKII